MLTMSYAVGRRDATWNRFRKTALAGYVAGLLAFAAIAPMSASGQTFGQKAIWGPAIHEGTSLFPTYRDLKVKIYEDDLHWSSIALRRPRDGRNPNDPAYSWPVEVTKATAEARHYHIQVALEIIDTPPWANGGKPWNWAPTDPKDYASFAIAAAKRYPSVHLWMIWGEPSRGHDFEPLDPAKPFAKLDVHQRSAPHRYAPILDTAYGALKSVSHSNLVIGGMTGAAGDISPQQWIENMRLPDGRPPRLDVYGHNPFTAREPNLADPPRSTSRSASLTSHA
jgi:hypothetical protein